MTNLRTWNAWKNTHQPFELGWWEQALREGHQGLPGHYEEVLDFIQPRGAVIDIGSGPRPAFAPCAVIEPLAFAYQKITPKEWWDGVAVFERPAEELIVGLSGDTIICWNCINHAIGWRQILDNMLLYGRQGARFAISTDFEEPFVGHPGFPKDEFMQEVEKRFKIIERREPFFSLHLALLMEAGG